jgi:hypothetical protein
VASRARRTATILAWILLADGLGGLAIWSWIVAREGLPPRDEFGPLLAVLAIALGAAGMAGTAGWVLAALRSSRGLRAAYVCMLVATAPAAIVGSVFGGVVFWQRVYRGMRLPTDLDFWLALPFWTAPVPLEFAALLLWLLRRPAILDPGHEA